MSALDVQEYITDETDDRGRVQVGSQHAGARLTYVVLDPDSLDRLAGPTTKTVPSDGRLSLGSDRAGEEVTVGLLKTDES